MTIRLLYDGPYGGHYEALAVTDSPVTEQTIKRRLFPGYMGISFGDDCSYEIIKMEKEAIGHGS